MDLITPDQARAAGREGQTFRERTMEQGIEIDEPRVGRQTMRDKLGLLALVLFNLLVLAGSGWIVVRVVKSL
jgi:hypothetical protein